MRKRLVGAKTLAWMAAPLLTLALLGAGPAPALRLPLQAEKLTAPEGATLPSYDAVEITPLAGGRYDVRLTPGDGAPKLSGVDLTVLAPRVPGLARGNETLTRLALIQREFNRNEVHNALPDGTDFSIANNCLQRGLWEIKLARSEGGKTATLFHAWFTFPQEEYARLFALANGGLEEPKFDGIFANYPGVRGFVLPLSDLRSGRIRADDPVAGQPRRQSAGPPARAEGQDEVDRARRGLDTYADVAKPANQPVTLAKFNVPGPLRSGRSRWSSDLAWLAHPKDLVWRRVHNPRAAQSFPELELRFENGTRILAADSRLASCPPAARFPPRRATC